MVGVINLYLYFLVELERSFQLAESNRINKLTIGFSNGLSFENYT